MIKFIRRCNRATSKTYADYAERFRNHAFDYNDHQGFQQNEQGDQTFAMILLENTNLIIAYN